MTVTLQVRGQLLLHHLSYLEERFGQEVLQGALSHCSKGVAAALQNAVVEGGWYPIVWLTSLQKGAVAATNSSSAIWELGHDEAPRFARERTGLALHFNSMWSVINRMPELLKERFTGCDVEVDLHPSGESAELRYKCCGGFTSLTWEMIEGGIVGVLEAAGAHGIQVVVKQGGGDDDDHFSFVVRYRGRPSLPPRG